MSKVEASCFLVKMKTVQGLSNFLRTNLNHLSSQTDLVSGGIGYAGLWSSDSNAQE
uniref:Ovule protein n=1 Tax=Mesocestoides corti TaxID=53468 RepID=A0A5K3FGM3_MESCO